MTKEQEKFLEPILNTFENEDIKNFAIELVNGFPKYIWDVGASSTGKYHPSYSLGEMGLMRHQVAVVRFINFFFELEHYQNKFESRKRDLIRLSGLVHDGRKSGSQEDYEKSKYTKFEHPLLMAKAILEYKDRGFLPNEELLFVAKLVSKHMGQWNTDKRKPTIILSKPDDEGSQLLHTADYLASRKCLNMSFEEYIMPKQKAEIKDPYEYIITFGQHSGKAIKDIPMSYIEWLYKRELREPLKSVVEQIVNDKSDKKELDTNV